MLIGLKLLIRRPFLRFCLARTASLQSQSFPPLSTIQKRTGSQKIFCISLFSVDISHTMKRLDKHMCPFQTKKFGINGAKKSRRFSRKTSTGILIPACYRVFETLTVKELIQVFLNGSNTLHILICQTKTLIISWSFTCWPDLKLVERL